MAEDVKNLSKSRTIILSLTEVEERKERTKDSKQSKSSINDEENKTFDLVT